MMQNLENECLPLSRKPLPLDETESSRLRANINYNMRHAVCDVNIMVYIQHGYSLVELLDQQNAWMPVIARPSISAVVPSQPCSFRYAPVLTMYIALTLIGLGHE